MTNEPHGRIAGTQGSQIDTQGRSLYEAISALTSELSLDVVLQKVADLSRQLVGATYSALGVVGEDGKLVQFITSGISQRNRERIGSIPEGKGVLGVVIRERKSLRLANITQHPESTGFPPNHPSMKSFLGVPVVSKGQVLGDLYLTNKIGAPEFSPDDEAMVTLFAAQAAVSIENARLFENETRRLAQLDVLNRIGRELTRIVDMDRIFDTVARMISEGFNYQNVQVLWVDKANNLLQVRALAGLIQDKSSLGATRSIDNGIAGWVARHEETALCDDVAHDTRYFPLPGLVTRSELAVPVLVKGEVIAVIDSGSMEPGAFDDSDVKTMETLADLLAVAIENIQLYGQQREQSRQLAVAEERERIGRDLHDGVIQSIYAVGLTLEDIAEHTEKEPTKIGPRVEGTVQDLNQVIKDIRSYIMDLLPRELQGRRPDEALESLIRYLEERSGASVELDAGIDLDSMPELYVVNLWHIFQEAFSNIEKYAGASRVTVSLAISDGVLSLEIGDDGVGFELEKAEMGRGYGLSNIKDRAERLGGILVIDSAPGKGTKLDIKVPLDKQTITSWTSRRTDYGTP